VTYKETVIMNPEKLRHLPAEIRGNRHTRFTGDQRFL